jgi:broad specificity phosphatase PhoE
MNANGSHKRYQAYPMKPVYLIRHGEGVNNIDQNICGWSNPELTPIGRKQAKALATRLKRMLKDQEFIIYSSPLKRAYQTAEIICKELEITPIIDDDLQEYKTGLPEQTTRSDAQQYFLDLTGPVKEFRTLDGAESFGAFFERAGRVIRRILDKHDETIVIVSHGWLIDKIVAWWVGISVDDIMPNIFVSGNACIHELGLSRHAERILVRLNDTNHLSP